MAKQNSYLTLVSDNSAAKHESSELLKRRARFVVAALGQLESKQQNSVSELVHTIHPSAALLGVQLGTQLNDLRPIIVIARELGPTLVRQVGGDGAGSATVHVREILERISASEDLKRLVQLVDWGFIGDSLFYRRNVVDSTLAATLETREELSFSDSLTVARRIIEAATALHEAGIIHGHITTNNIALSRHNEVFLLDPGVGVGLFRSALEHNAESGRPDVDVMSFAPEIRQSGTVVRSSDVYAIGVVLKELFESLHGAEQNIRSIHKRPQSFVTLSDLVEAMTDENPARRPSLEEVNTFLGQASGADQELSTVSTEIKLKAFTGASLGKGKMVRITRAAGSHVDEERQQRIENARRAARGIQFDLTAVVEQAPESKSTAPKQNSAEPAREDNPQSAETEAAHEVHKTLKSEHPAVAAAESLQPPVGMLPPNYFAQHPGAIPPHAYQMHQPVAPQFYYGQLQGPANPYAAGASTYFPNQLPAAPEMPQQTQSPAAQAPRSSSGSAFWASLMTLIVLCCGVYYKQSQADTGYSSDEQELAWFSKRPSLMIPVAERALSSYEPDAFAEMLVVSSIMKGEANVAGVNQELLKVAFDSRWEQSLTPEDRRVALALALTGLLREKTPTDLQPIQSTHPGVVLAIASTGGSRVSTFLSRVPAQMLTTLPKPLGTAFAVLTDGHDDMNCGDEAIRSLAHFVSRGWSSTDELYTFLGTDTQTRLKALTEVFKLDAAKSAELLALLLEHPNKSLDTELVSWARTWKLAEWSELSDYSKLQLLSGVIPAQSVKVEDVAKLFAHPSPNIRAAAMKQAVDSIAFGHPAAADILNYLASKPELLTPRQTVILAQLLEAPKKVEVSDVRQWLDSNPPVDLVAFLLVGSAYADNSSSLDFELARYMKSKNWQPDAAALKVLVRHPEKLVRMYAYIQTFNLKDKETATMILSSARRSEQDPEFRRQIEAMIADITR